MCFLNLIQGSSKWEESPLGVDFHGKEDENIKKGDKGTKKHQGEKTLYHLSITRLTSVSYKYELLVSCKF